jgi:hypothetical protein
MSRVVARKILAALVVILIACAGTWSVYRETLQYGFDYDDYHTIRPYSQQEILATFHGPWDAHGEVMAPFYRPLTVAFHALRFELFGLNSTAHHAMSLALFAIGAALMAWLVFRFTNRATAAVLGMLVFISHPAMPYSAVAWITNQMHLLQTLVVFGALVWWDAVRARGLWWWLPLLLFGAASFLIKEDGVMLLHAIIFLHALRRRVAERNLRSVPWGFVALAGLLILALMIVRFYSLRGLGGYGPTSWAAAWPRVVGSLDGVFRLVPADRPWQPLASWFATVLPFLALVAWRWISPGARLCLASGAAIAVAFALPFVFASKAEQLYLVGLGASLVLTGASMAMVELAGRMPAPRTVSAVAVAAVATGLVSFVVVTRDITRDFEPFGPIVLARDDTVRTWWSVPPELREYLARKREPGSAERMSANPIDELSQVSFGFWVREVSPTGTPYLWMTEPQVEIQVGASARQVSVPIRHEIGAFREPARAFIVANGRFVEDLRLDNADWRTVSIALRQRGVAGIARMHRIKIAIDRVWRPSDVIPGSTDTRVLGLQVGTLQVR